MLTFVCVLNKPQRCSFEKNKKIPASIFMKNLRYRLPVNKTKLICTIGPASCSGPVLRKLIKSGMNVARLNFSHGSLESHRKNILQIRSAARQLKRDIVILADLPGTKIRIGRLSHEPIFLKKGSGGCLLCYLPRPVQLLR